MKISRVGWFYIGLSVISTIGVLVMNRISHRDLSLQASVPVQSTEVPTEEKTVESKPDSAGAEKAEED